jgi:hypothetical protein
VGTNLKEQMAFWLDWLNRGYLLVQIFGGLGVGSAVRACLLAYTKTPSVWVTPIWLLASGTTVAFLVILGNKTLHRPHGQMSSAQSAPNALATPTAAFDASAFFAQSYSSPLQPEIEANIRAAAIRTQPNDREGFYVRFIGAGTIIYVYDMVWFSIYRSQILSLMELNRRMLPLSEIRSFYDRAATEYPAYYARYSLDQWLGYLKTHSLLIQHASDMVEITVRGRDFLKYLVHYGRYADDRTL